jgi:hypothetical protein
VLATVVVLGSLVAACGGSDPEEDQESTTTTTVLATLTPEEEGAAASGEGSPDSSTTPATTDEVEDGSAAADEPCVVGTYRLDGDHLFDQVIAASGGGGAEMVGGAVVLEMRDDRSAEIVMDGWSFRLSFPGGTDTVLATQSGGLTGTWDVDDDGRPVVIFATQDVTGSFVLETASGPFPVPSGMEVPAPPTEVPLAVDCTDGEVVLPVEDVQIGVTLLWRFGRV